jgi:hypothetical protein
MQPDSAKRPVTGVCAGQGPFSVWWQVQDSNLRRHTPTDLQSGKHNALTCTDS